MVKRRVLTIVLIVLIAAAAIVGVVYLRDAILRLEYPLKYESTVVQYSKQYELDPYFVCALIDTESNFNDQAVSKDGAKGLMQIMPDTADWIAQKMDEKSYDLLDPATNIQFGCWYLNFLKDKFSGDQQLMIAAYNAGHNKVEQWLAEGYGTQNGSALDEIPYAETKEYVDKVNRAYDEYQKLYKIQ